MQLSGIANRCKLEIVLVGEVFGRILTALGPGRTDLVLRIASGAELVVADVAGQSCLWKWDREGVECQRLSIDSFLLELRARILLTLILEPLALKF